jgi:hypothetical protein
MTDATNIFPGVTIGHWFVLAVNGRRAACRCRCGVTRAVAVSALMSGESTSCGCAALTAEQEKSLRNAREARERQRELRNWRPGGRS